MRLERRSTSIGAHVGAFGILISGAALVSIPSGPQWGWLNFQLYPWLVIKQILFLVILVLVGFSIKCSLAFKRELKLEKEVLSSATSRKWKSAYRLSMAVYFLVVINTILGFSKFNLGF